eukprot:1219493-Amphidinium_carterae.1
MCSSPGRDHHRHLPPPLVPEFSCVLVLPAVSRKPLHHLLRTEVDGDGRVCHPFDLDATVPSARLHSLGGYLEIHPARVVQSRSDYLKVIFCEKRELESQGKALHASLPCSLQKALKGKSLLLLQCALKQAHFPDVHLVSDMIQGFRTMRKARLVDLLCIRRHCSRLDD